MAIQKINPRSAQNISEKVADKAFEHLIGPLQKRLDEVMGKAYWAALREMGVNTDVVDNLVEGEVLQWVPFCRVTLSAYDDLSIDGGEWRSDNLRFVSDKIKIIDPQSCKEIMEANEALQPMITKQDKLRRTVHYQIQGKSVSTVVKNWPEIREMVEDVMGEDVMGEVPAASGTVVPFDQLLARFMPMLPAPAAV